MLFVSVLFGIALAMVGEKARPTLQLLESLSHTFFRLVGFLMKAVPIAGMTLILGIDRFMSECRALTNFIGNAVATVVVSRWEGGLDREAFQEAMVSAAPRPAIPRAPSRAGSSENPPPSRRKSQGFRALGGVPKK